MSTDDEIRMILNGRDIEILRERFLCALNDMDGVENRHFDFPQLDSMDFDIEGFKRVDDNFVEIDDDAGETDEDFKSEYERYYKSSQWNLITKRNLLR
jgi:hypothetical protein